MSRGEVRRNEGIFDDKPQAIPLRPKKLTIMVEDDIRGTTLPFLLVVLIRV